MAAFLVVEIAVEDQKKFEKYKQMAAPTILAYGGRYWVRGGVIETLEGDWNPERLIIIEFESTNRAKQWWNSPEYEQAKTLRQQAANTRMILVEGLA